MTLARRALVVCALILIAPRSYAQVGSTTDILMGQVTGPDGKPLEGARVDVVSSETQVARTKLTNAQGRYTVVFPDGGGQYTLTARFLGMAPRSVTVTRQGDEDRLYTNVQLTTIAATTLATVEVRARRAQPPLRAEPGSLERTITPEQAARLPIDPSDLNALATLAPGVVGIEGSDTSAAGFSVAGQRPTQNQMTLDGISFGAASLPSEALRATRVITNTYDVARGQFTGGEIASTTRSGTNVLQGAFGYSLRDPVLEFTGDQSSSFDQRYTQNQLSGGLGGPILKNKLFTFGAVQLRRRTDQLQTLTSASAATLEGLGTQPDSVARFLGLLGSKSIPVSAAAVPGERLADNVSVLERTDWLLNDSHTLMLRGDWRWNIQNGSRLSAFATPATGGDLTSLGGGAMLSLTSHFESGYINELRTYYSTDTRKTEPYIALPEGRVRVASALPDGTTGISTLAFGGNPSLPQTAANDYVESSDEFSWLSSTGSHRVKLGALLNVGRYSQGLSANQLGIFSYNSLADFAADQPSSFVRTLSPTDRRGSAVNSALYLGDSWRRSQALQLVYGVRLEGSRYGGAPADNREVDSLFGGRTDRFPSEVHLSPRLGFSYVVTGGQGNPPLGTFRGGIGEFRGRAPVSLFSGAQNATGFAGAESQLICIGAGVPVPSWEDYLASPQSIPSICSDSGPPASVLSRPTVTLFDRTFQAPRSWRASLGVQRRFHETLGFSIDATYARGVSLYGVTDLNLDTVPRFRLASEANRPVYAPPEAIVAGTGAVGLAGSREHPQYAQVLQINSGLHSDTRQVTLGLNGLTAKGMIFSTSYTLSRSRDQSSFSCCSALQGFSSATTRGNPNALDVATSDLERRHAFLATVTYPFTSWMELTMIGRLSSGAAFTPLIGSDINGDGARNDRAFIFDPAATSDSAVANGISRLLSGSSSRVRDCLRRQLGQIAGRNSCTRSWLPSLDFQANFRPTAWGLERRLTLSVIAVNSLAGADQLLHGNALRGWGQPNRPDPTLLYVRGFDPVSERYLYQVNERFGNTTASRQVFRVPFQLALQGRFTIGPDRTRERLQGLFGAGGRRGGEGGEGRAGAGGAGATGGDMSARLERLMPNPIGQIIALKDSLQLSESQLSALQLVADTLKARTDSLGATIRAMVEKAGKNPDPGFLFSTLRPKLTEGRNNLQQSLKAAQKILSPEQWAKVPATVKNPLARFGGPGGGGALRP